MPGHQAIRSGRFYQGKEYATRRPNGGAEWLLIVTIRGGGYHRHGLDLVRLPRGTALLYAPGVAQDYGSHPADRAWELVFAHFHAEARLRPLLDWPGAAGAVGVLELAGAFDPVAAAMDELVAWQQGGSPHRSAFAANALERALLWCDTVNPHNPRSSMDARVEQALALIASGLAGPLTVTGIASSLGISGSRLSHLFASQVGASFPAYVESRRMERAENLLRMTDRDVAAIARSVGYEDPLYFSRRFSARTGTSPRTWRNRTGDGRATTG